MKNIWLKFISFFFIASYAISAKIANAGLNQAFDVVKNTAGGSYNTDLGFNTTLGNIVSLILSIIGVLFIIFMIYAGYLWMTAFGNDTKLEKSKEILKQSIIGLIVVIAAYAISYFIVIIFGKQINLQ